MINLGTKLVWKIFFQRKRKMAIVSLFSKLHQESYPKRIKAQGFNR
jgi:hypothetical protein